ncbi:Ras-related protein Rab-28 [Durusdinium trenchii]|uniref:Ras-related protein Rab-28 n=1 Tax=Durusdinium trenchii TaxID=1381693 RepID=A0ABP0S6M8_9DINO
MRERKRSKAADNTDRLGEDDDDDEPEYLQFKVILLGDGAVGKTSLATRFCEDHFAKQYKQTIGLDFFVKRVVLPGDIHVCLQIWDIGGQSIGGKMLSNYTYGSGAVVLCYDITNYASFQHLEDWLFLVKRTFDQTPMPYTALMGNKADLSHIRAVKTEKHSQFADENDLYSYFVSARTGDQAGLGPGSAEGRLEDEDGSTKFEDILRQEVDIIRHLFGQGSKSLETARCVWLRVHPVAGQG